MINNLVAIHYRFTGVVLINKLYVFPFLINPDFILTILMCKVIGE